MVTYCTFYHIFYSIIICVVKPHRLAPNKMEKVTINDYLSWLIGPKSTSLPLYL